MQIRKKNRKRIYKKWEMNEQRREERTSTEKREERIGKETRDLNY